MASTKDPANTAERFEAEIRKRARPMLSPEERKARGREKAMLDMQYAAARAREAAEAQLKRAEEFDETVAKLEKGK